MAASVPPVPPLSAMLVLVIDGREAKSGDRAVEVARTLGNGTAAVADIGEVDDRHRGIGAGDGRATVGSLQRAVHGEGRVQISRSSFRYSCGKR